MAASTVYNVENNFANRLFGGTYPSPVLKYQRKKFVWQGQSVVQHIFIVFE